MSCFRVAHVWSRIDPVGKRRKPLEEHRQCFVAAAGEAFFLPDFVQPPRIAIVAADEVAAANFEPPCDPDIDRIGLAQRRAGGARVGDEMGGTRHAATHGLDARRQVLLIGSKRSNLMAAPRR